MPGAEDGPGTAPAAARPPGEASRAGTRAAFAVALGLLAAMLVASARTPPPALGDRVGQRVRMVELINAEQARNDDLAASVEQLTGRVAALEREVGAETEEVVGLQEQVDQLAAPAGLTPLAGPGLAVTLTDSTDRPPDGEDVNDYVIHEDDLQAVINALWAGGAEALAVNGDRILATTAIRCVGNVLLLHGRTHSPPYTIEAVGDREELLAALARDPGVERFAQAVQQFKLGYEVEDADELLLAAYEGGTGLQSARPVTEDDA